MARSKGGKKLASCRTKPETPVQDCLRQKIAGRTNPSEIAHAAHSSMSAGKTTSSAADISGPQQNSASQVSLFPAVDGCEESISISPVKDTCGRIYPKQSFDKTEKRDSVISSNWDEAKAMENIPIPAKRGSYLGPWRKTFKYFSSWPCRTCRQFRMFTLAVIQGFQNRRRNDFILAFGALFVCLYAIYIALDLILTGLIKGVNAQDIVEAANCSIVYVTMPGPIITVSLIAASPTDPAQGTYYYSEINGATEWLNSITPPIRTSAKTSHISLPATAVSSLYLFGSVGLIGSIGPGIPTPSSTGVPSQTISLPPGFATTIINTITSSDVFMLSTATLMPSTVLLPPVFSNPPSPSSDFFSRTDTLIVQPSMTYLSVTSSTTLSRLSPTPSLTRTVSPTAVFSSSSMPVGPTSGLPPSAITSFPLSTSSLVASTPLNPASGGSSALITSIASGGWTTIVTNTSTTLLDGPQNSTSAPELPPLGVGSTISRITLPNGRTIELSKSATPPGAVSSVALTTVVSLSLGLLTTMETVLPDGEMTTVMLFTDLFSVMPTASPSLDVTPGSPIAFTTTLVGGEITTFITTLTTNIGGATSFPTPPWESASPSKPSTALISVAPSGGGFTVSLPRPATGSSRGAPTSTRTTSDQSRFDTAKASTTLSTSGRSPAAGSRTTSVPFSKTGPPSAPQLPSNPTSSILISSSRVVISRSLSLFSISRGVSGISSSSLPSTSQQSSSTILSFPGGSTQDLPSDLFDSSASSIQDSRTLTPSLFLTSGSAALTTRDFSPTIGTLPTRPASGTNTRSQPFSSEMAGFLTTTTLTVPSMDILTSSGNVQSSLSFTSGSSIGASTGVTQLFSTTLAVFNTSSSSSTSPSGLSSEVSVNTTLTSAIAGLLSSSLLSSTITSGSSLALPMFPSSRSVNTSSTASSTTSSGLLSFSPSSGQSPPASNPAAPLLPPTAPAIFSSNSSSTVLNSTSFSTRTSTVTLTSAPIVVTSVAQSYNGTSGIQARALMTRIVSYGDTSVVFVFPTPSIVTTHTYWTGTYPTVTGPEPSDLQTMPLTTRSIRQTALSELPPFELLTTNSFRTVTNAVARAAAPTLVDRAPAAEASYCGESGNFTLSFDDTTVGPLENNLVAVHGLKNPYHHLFYANGFTYVPDKWEPYPAISQPNIAIFLPLTGRLLPNTPFAGTLLPGELGAGPRASVRAYWFNAYSGYFGCALSGLTPCTLRISGYRYDAVLKQEVLVAEQNATLPACWAYVNCQLTQVLFNEQFRALSGIQFNAFTYNVGIPQVHMMDDLQMEWYDNSCSAGILRIGHW